MRNRGPQPNDHHLFHPRQLPTLTAATNDLCWLLTRSYGLESALQLVGNRYRLNKRQRTAVGRCAASDRAVQNRKSKEVKPSELNDRDVAIDGFNLLILLESRLGGAVVLEGRDGAYRDLASVHGTYKHVRHTRPALLLVGEALRPARSVVWYLDQPVSNSGRLKTMLRELAAEHGFAWTVELAYNPDRVLMDLPPTTVLVTSDSWILDEGGAWCNLGKVVDAPAPLVI